MAGYTNWNLSDRANEYAEKYQVNGFPLQHDGDGYFLETDKHRYEFYELIPVGASKSLTSDMLMIVCDDYNTNPDSFTEIVGWEYGALDFPDTYTWEHIAEMIQDYEKTGRAMR